MSNTSTNTNHISRAEVISLLRNELALLTDDENSICKIAAEKGIFCRGFHRYSDRELKDRYGWIYRKQPGGSRADLEAVANRWQLARQDVTAQPTSCDVQQLEHDSCQGWDDFTSSELALFYCELTGKTLSVN